LQLATGGIDVTQTRLPLGGKLKQGLIIPALAGSVIISAVYGDEQAGLPAPRSGAAFGKSVEFAVCCLVLQVEKSNYA
jgi:hypothetical protein